MCAVIWRIFQGGAGSCRLELDNLATAHGPTSSSHCIQTQRHVAAIAAAASFFPMHNIFTLRPENGAFATLSSAGSFWPDQYDVARSMVRLPLQLIYLFLF